LEFKKLKFLFLIFFTFSLFSNELDNLFVSLKNVENIDKKNKDKLPLIYNSMGMGGYLTMPSSRVSEVGTFFIGASYLPPYNIYAATVQPYSPIEFSGNYIVFTNQLEGNFGHKGFGDDADRTINCKFSFPFPKYQNIELPILGAGFNDFVGSRRFYSLYGVLTQVITDWNLELTLGYGKGRIDGFFGGAAFTPWRFSKTPILKDVTFFAEYDANDYKNKHEHPDGREVKSRINGGLAVTLFDALQVKGSFVRGKEWAASAGLFYNFGESRGMLPKVGDPPLYSAPINHEPLSPIREEKELAYELALELGKQGLNVARILLSYDEEDRKILYIRLINLRYFKTRDARIRIQSVLAALVPENIYCTNVALEEGGILVQSYSYLTSQLLEYNEGKISEEEMKILSPPQEAHLEPSEYDASLLFKRDKTLWSFLARPRLLSFFGSSTGKYKYALGLIGGPQGYIADSLYYKIQMGYNIISSTSTVGDIDCLNPSQLINVRSDSINYYKSNTVALEQAYLQKGWRGNKGWFYRVAAGYFEVAYAGVAMEALFAPMDWNFAVGFEAACVMKRQYQGLGFQYHVRKLDGCTPHYVPFVGFQYFLDWYYNIKPLSLNLEMQIGQFLARDRGVRTILTRYFKSGVTLSFWITFTNAKDVVNRHIYYDKGIAFSIPFDMFLHKSSRASVGYATSFWLRDCGAEAMTGRRLYPTVQSARIYN
jgi:hypothetical protein